MNWLSYRSKREDICTEVIETCSTGLTKSIEGPLKVANKWGREGSRNPGGCSMYIESLKHPLRKAFLISNYCISQLWTNAIVKATQIVEGLITGENVSWKSMLGCWLNNLATSRAFNYSNDLSDISFVLYTHLELRYELPTLNSPLPSDWKTCFPNFLLSCSWNKIKHYKKSDLSFGGK